jgi:hypothetical protein
MKRHVGVRHLSGPISSIEGLPKCTGR